MNKTISVQLDKELLEQVRALAKAEERPIARQLAIVVRRGLEAVPAQERK